MSFGKGPSKGPRRTVTSHDVAKLAGVSRAAVSRTFTPNASVSDETREKVHQAARELGYRVNFLARGLINQRSDLVGLVAAGLDNPYRSIQVDHLTRELLSRGLRPLLLPTSRSEDVGTFIEHLLQYSVTGVIITSDAPPTAVCEECSRNGIPIVMINKGEEIPLVDRVVNDDKAAGQQAFKLLNEIGCSRVGVVASSVISFTGRQRLAAFVNAARTAGKDAQHFEVPVNDYRSGFEAAKAARDSAADGLFCVNDYLACGVIDGLAALGARSEIRVVGHDDIQQASWHAYQLSTIAQPCDVQAAAAIDLLEERIALPDAPGKLVTTPIFLVRRKSA